MAAASGQGWHGPGLGPLLEALVQPLDRVRGPRRSLPARGKVEKGEQAAVGLLQAGGDRRAAQAPLPAHCSNCPPMNPRASSRMPISHGIEPGIPCARRCNFRRRAVLFRGLVSTEAPTPAMARCTNRRSGSRFRRIRDGIPHGCRSLLSSTVPTWIGPFSLAGRHFHDAKLWNAVGHPMEHKLFNTELAWCRRGVRQDGSQLRSRSGLLGENRWLRMSGAWGNPGRGPLRGQHRRNPVWIRCSALSFRRTT